MALLLLTGNQRAHAQGTFQNLSFENPRLPLILGPDARLSAADAIPGWTAYIGENQVDRVIYNTFALDLATVSLQGPGSDLTPLLGNYSVYLRGPSQFVPPGNPAIAQTGQIPPDAKSLVFITGLSYAFNTTFAGNAIPLVQIGATPKYVILSGDVSAFAGQTGELRFSGGGFLDAIHFSSSAVPEPSVLGLTILGALILGWRWRRSSRA